MTGDRKDGKTIVREGKTMSRMTNRMTRAQTVAAMNYHNAGIRATASYLVIGAD